MVCCHAALMPLQEPGTLQPDMMVMLAEAAAKAAEHTALLRILQQQHQQQSQLEDEAKTGSTAAPWYQPLSEARGATGATCRAGYGCRCLPGQVV